MTRYAQKYSLPFAGFVLLLSVFIVSAVWAEAGIPIPKNKPILNNSSSSVILAGVPIPQIKPTLKSKPEIIVAVANPKDLEVAADKSSMLAGLFSDKQARLYERIFAAQRYGNFAEADALLKKVNTPLLKGHVLAQRYLHPHGAKVSYGELEQWMTLYNDHPQAAQIYKLAQTKKPRGTKATLVEPLSHKKLRGNLSAVSTRGKVYKSQKSRDNAQYSRVKKLKRNISRHVERMEPTLALNLLSNDYALQFMDDVEYDRLRAEIAAGYLYAGKLDSALRLSTEALKRSGEAVPQAGWVQGLAHWKKGHYKAATQGFEVAAKSPYSSGWMVSASAYWASRAHMRAGNEKQVAQWLQKSATYPRTFYGLIANRALGKTTKFNWDIPSLNREHAKWIESDPKGQRANALIMARQLNLAEAELNNIHPGASQAKQEALLAYASHYELPSLSLKLGNAFSNPNGGLYDGALYPVAAWAPEKGYRVDKALILAIIRQESRFHAAAQNPSGATGLMQLMPKTAAYVAEKINYTNKTSPYHLKNPAVNLEIGQAYIERLLNDRAVGQDLLSLAIAYNAGPGNLNKWKSQRAGIKDPLLFIETIPFNETRAFVERVLSNYWIYRMRLNQDTPSLDAVAKGKWARYATQDAGLSKLASR